MIKPATHGKSKIVFSSSWQSKLGKLFKMPGASIIDGNDPLTDPFSLLLIQILVIISLTRLIGLILRYLGQPRFIAEVIAGILLGQSALSRIPEFKNSLFPASSLPGLKLVSNVGLIFFLFLVFLN